MKRRAFILALGGAAASVPLAARAQQNEPTRQIGILMTTADDPEGQRRLSAFREGLEKRGWAEGKNIRIEVNWSVSDAERARSAVDELIDGSADRCGATGIVGEVEGVAASVRQRRRSPSRSGWS